MKIKTFCGGFDNNFTYLIHDASECCIIDAGLYPQKIEPYLNEQNLTLKFVVIMHSHADHTIGYQWYKQHGVPLYGHSSLQMDIEKKLDDGDVFHLGSIRFTVLHTPGHLYDAICLLTGKHLFTSDTLFVQGCGRADLVGADPEKLYESLQRLQQLPDATIVYPGHDYGDTPTSTIGREKMQNRFFNLSKDEFLGRRMG
jgi:hydroxyacylglutathione hydrolase